MQAQPDLILRLWTAARAMFARLRAAVGESAVIAGYARLNEVERRTLRAWLRPLEVMVRKIVLIEAIALAGQPEAPRKPIARRERAAVRKPRAATLRLWPRSPRSSQGPRIRSLGPDLLVRDINRAQGRLALARHLNAIRFKRVGEGARAARRIDALERIIARPQPAARRLARKLRVKPNLALKLAAKTPPRSKLYAEPEYALSNVRAYEQARAWTARAPPATG